MNYIIYIIKLINLIKLYIINFLIKNICVICNVFPKYLQIYYLFKLGIKKLEIILKYIK